MGFPWKLELLFVPGELVTPHRKRRVLDLSTLSRIGVLRPPLLSGESSKPSIDSKGILGGSKAYR